MSERKVTFERFTPKGISAHHYRVAVNGCEVGEIRCAFTKPKEMRGHFTDFRGENWMVPVRKNALRRGWGTTTDLDIALGIHHMGSCYTAYPFRELKALVEHCLTNQISLDGMRTKEVIALAKHCRAMELARKRRGK